MTFFQKLALLFILLLASCTSKPVESKQVLHLNIIEDATSLDPRCVRRLKDLTLVRQLFEGLTRLDENHVPQLALADGYTISEDLLTYTFHLRDHSWTNGERITADDFVYSWRKALDPNFPTEYAHMLFCIKNGKKAHAGKCSLEQIGVRAPDCQTLIVKLEKPTPYFLELVAFPTYFPVNRNTDLNFPAWVNPPGKHFVSCGPFSLEKWIPETEIVMKKNESYWDAAHVFLDKIHFSMIADSNTESLLFERGELDWLGQPHSNNISTELLSQLKEQHLLASYPIAGTFWLKCNVTKPPLNNAQIRKAFALAINRRALIDHILLGNQSVATSPVPPSLALSSTPHFTDGDTERALLLFEEGLKEEGWTRELMPPIELKYQMRERDTKIVQFVQEQLQALFHIPILLKGMEYQLYLQECRSGNFQLATGQWIADYHDPIAFLEIFLANSGINDTQWQDKRFTRLLEQSSRNPAKRSAYLSEAEEILLDQMPIIPLYHYAFDFVKKPNLEGVVLSPLGGSDLKSARLR